MRLIGLNKLRMISDKFNRNLQYTENSLVSLFMYSHLYEIKQDKCFTYFEYYDSKTIILVHDIDYSLDSMVKKLIEYIELNKNRLILIESDNEEFLEYIKLYQSIEVSEYRDLFEYIYNVDDLIHLKGKVYNKKRGHINRLLASYSENTIEYRRIYSDEVLECLRVLNLWTVNRNLTGDISNENIAVHNIINNYKDLSEDMVIGGIYINNTLEAFTVGSIINNTTCAIHVEKANPNIKGLYQLINMEFLKNEFSYMKFVNREDDMGIEGLRNSKMSYNPCKFLKRYKINLIK